MESAKSAGWAMVGWSFSLAATLAIVHFISPVFSSVPLLAGAVKAIAVVIWVTLFVCVFYAIWGLSCGYDPKAWDAYAKRTDEDTRKGARAACEQQGLTPPPWL